MLALSTAAGLASPFEEYFLTGQTISAPDQITLGRRVLAAAGMRMGASSWLVATPVYSASLTSTQVEFDLRLPHDEYGKATKLSACELISGQSYAFDIKIAAHCSGGMAPNLNFDKKPGGTGVSYAALGVPTTKPLIHYNL